MSRMAETANLPEITESFESVERLVMETPRGRWFLEEFARRQRAKELTLILDSIQRLENALALKETSARTDDLAQRINKAIDAPSVPQPAPENLEARQLRYFRKDEEVFQPAPSPTPKAVETEPKAAGEPEPERKGARLIIRRKEDVVSADPFAPTPPVKEPEPVPQLAAQPDEPPKRRIVIIRHKAGEDMTVPLQNETAVAS